MTTVCVGEEAIERLASFWTSAVGSPALVAMDTNTERAAGWRVVEALRGAGVEVEQLVLGQGSGLRPTPDEVEAVRSRLTEDRVPVAVGSGVVTDIVRYAAHLDDREFLSVPTAASMDGYASSMAALERDGVKVTHPARAPSAIFADPRVLASAPGELTRAGLGDLLGKATAHVDWLAAHLLYGEDYSAAAARLVIEPLEFAARQTDAVLHGQPAAIEKLFDGLIQSGRAMAFVGSSRPASGCEHHASHFWDLLASRGLRAQASHGLQVGYATRFAMRLQRFAFDGGLPVLRRPVAVADPLGAEARRWLGQPSAEIVAAVEEKAAGAADLGRWPADAASWEAMRSSIRPALEMFSEVERALTLAGIPDGPGFLGVDEAMLRATFRYATRLRARYTVIDLLDGQGMLDRAIEAMLG
ncbi:MAG: iron-containing alcohol dehydrogenase [Solirubrobacteraceae bacterium]